MINVFTKKINDKCIYLPFDHQYYNEILKTGSLLILIELILSKLFLKQLKIKIL